MITLTRPDGSTLLINPDRIETVEETPDTVLTMADGKKLLVREAAATVAGRFQEYQRSLRVERRLDDSVGGERSAEPEGRDHEEHAPDSQGASRRTRRATRRTGREGRDA